MAYDHALTLIHANVRLLNDVHLSPEWLLSLSEALSGSGECLCHG